MMQETIALHGSYDKDSQLTMAVPIYQTTAYEYKSAEHAASLFSLKEFGNIYTRLSNPTTDIFEKRFAQVEGGAMAIASSSGMSSILFSIVNLAESGDNIIVSDKLYGGSITLFGHTLKRFGIEARSFDSNNPSTIENLVDDRTKVIFFESISNPSVDVADVEKIVKIAKKNDIVTVCDNTVATPYLFKAFEHGVDVTVHSASKYTTGQGLAIGGIMVEREGLNDLLRDNPRYTHFAKPDESYHGLVYLDLPIPAFSARARLSLSRDLGAVLSPFNSWLFIQGLETLGLRIEKHTKSALEVAKFLESHPKVNSVKYPYLASDDNYEKAKKYLKGGSGILSFDVGSFDLAKKIMDSVKIFTIVSNIGDSKSIITHSASTTHQQLSSAELKACGVTKGLVRLSIGLEDPKDLIEDLKNALK